MEGFVSACALAKAVTMKGVDDAPEFKTKKNPDIAIEVLLFLRVLIMRVLRRRPKNSLDEAAYLAVELRNFEATN